MKPRDLVDESYDRYQQHFPCDRRLREKALGQPTGTLLSYIVVPTNLSIQGDVFSPFKSASMFRLIAKVVAGSAVLMFISSVHGQVENEQPPKPAPITDPALAGPDFALQGEYAGWARTPGGASQWVGLQVVALGDDKFEALGYRGGLPGNGWDRVARKKLSGQMVDGNLVLTGP